MNKQISKMGAIALLAFCIGIFWNMLYSRGIHPRELMVLLSSINQTDFQTVSVDSAIYMMFEEEALFIDIRSAEDYQIDHIPHAISMPFRQFVRSPSQIKSSLDGRPVVLYSFYPDNREVIYMGKLMKKQGVRQIQLLKEGFAGWIENEMPVERREQRD